MKFATIALTAALLFFPLKAQAQGKIPISCGSRANLISLLSTALGEIVVGSGVVVNGRILDLLVNKEGEWTLLITNENGVTCIAAFGSNWVKSKALGDPA